MFYESSQSKCSLCYKTMLDPDGVCSLVATDKNAEIYDAQGKIVQCAIGFSLDK